MEGWSNARLGGWLRMTVWGMKRGSRRQAECRLWVQKGDDRRNAPQWARCAVNDHSRYCEESKFGTALWRTWPTQQLFKSDNHV
jgi:hypothetical protein